MFNSVRLQRPPANDKTLLRNHYFPIFSCFRALQTFDAEHFFLRSINNNNNNKICSETFCFRNICFLRLRTGKLCCGNILGNVFSTMFSCLPGAYQLSHAIISEQYYVALLSHPSMIMSRIQNYTHGLYVIMNKTLNATLSVNSFTFRSLFIFFQWVFEFASLLLAVNQYWWAFTDLEF